MSAGTSNYEQDSGNYLGEFGVSRHNADGSLDASFSDDGRLTTSFGPNLGAYAQAVALQADGKIVVAGNRRESNVVTRTCTSPSSATAPTVRSTPRSRAMAS